MKKWILALALFLAITSVVSAKDKAGKPISVVTTDKMLVAEEGDSYQWYFNGKKLDGVTNQKIKALKSGTYSVVVKDGKDQLKSTVTIKNNGKKIIRILMAGDSTMADYTLLKDKDYMRHRYPLTGWGQVFPEFFTTENMAKINHLLKADSVIIDDRAVGGRSSRSFFQEGRWRKLLNTAKAGDFVIIQFGHNDQTPQRPNRYVTPHSYKEFLRLFVAQTREKGATPILVTPMAQNKRWENGQLLNTHGDYPDAMKAVANEMGVYLIDLNQLSMDFFTKKGEEFVTNNYFMNLPEGKYESAPKGKKDNTHFQTDGAIEIARLVFEAMCQLQ